ncbi:hypothetical protein [Dietzia sp. ANT_WB102]|uniref:hypothetical protein n=1 Tax=Dietzia sp. ANT_WB102 TaxID=2597345 RepID=UPI0011EC7CE4|nr:hypothetical protein [Dietzia sp. ANT_WB102]KAA0916458.1 hypothetical protein FQ137_14645 [Dietzia sp. ANT_WB102]
MTAPIDLWADLPIDGETAQALSGGMLLADSDDSAASVRRILSWVRTYCGWHVIGERAETLIVDGTGASTVHLPTLRVVDVAEVSEEWWTGQGVETSLLPATGYSWSVHGVVEKRSGVWTRERRGVKVSLTHGFDAADDLLGVVVHAAVRHTSAPDGNALARVGDISYQSSGAGAAGGSAFLQSEYAVLDHYRLNPGV